MKAYARQGIAIFNSFVTGSFENIHPYSDPSSKPSGGVSSPSFKQSMIVGIDYTQIYDQILMYLKKMNAPSFFHYSPLFRG